MREGEQDCMSSLEGAAVPCYRQVHLPVEPVSPAQAAVDSLRNQRHPHPHTLSGVPPESRQDAW